VTANGATKVYGAALPNFSAAITGFVNGDTAAMVTGTPSLTTTATAASVPGSYPIGAAVGTLVAPASYTINYVIGTLTVGKAATAMWVATGANTATAVVNAAQYLWRDRKRPSAHRQVP
jgi:hypothetical protein